MVDADAERLRDAVGRDVVMGRPDAAGGKDVIVAFSQCIKGGNDVGLLVGDDADFLEVDPDIGQVLGDKADVLVLGPAGQDLVTNDQNARCDDLTHMLSSPSPARHCAQRLEVTGLCCRNKHPPAGFSGSAAYHPYQMPPANAYRAGPALATIPSSHALWSHGFER